MFHNQNEQKELQKRLRDLIYTFFQQSWDPQSYDWECSDRGFAADFLDGTSMFNEVRSIRPIERTEGITRLYVNVIDVQIHSEYEVRCAVEKVFSIVSEDFLIFVPYHTEEEWRYWFITGTPTHGHEGMVIVNRADNPQITE